MTLYNIVPMGAPRMTQRDRWKKRPVVMRYFDFKDQVKYHGINIPDIPLIIFHIPMPPSWSGKKKKEFDGKPHQNKPDKDNLEKALYDSIYAEDCHIWCGWVEKRWAYKGGIEIIDLCHTDIVSLLNYARQSVVTAIPVGD